MDEEHLVRARRRSDGQLEQVFPDGSTRILQVNTDWARVDAMTEEELHQNALSDPDNPPRTAEELARMPRIPNPQRLRERLDLTQEEFASQFQISLGTIRDWEQNARLPDSTAIAYLRVIEKIPDAVREALKVDPIEPAASAPETREERVG